MDDIDKTRAMHLRDVSIANFRSCRDTALRLQKNLTVLVGENNAGKSNVIDALRLSTVPLSKRRTRYFEVDDVARDHPRDAVTIETTFADLTEFQAAHYIAAYDMSDQTATYRTTFTPDVDSPP